MRQMREERREDSIKLEEDPTFYGNPVNESEEYTTDSDPEQSKSQEEEGS